MLAVVLIGSACAKAAEPPPLLSGIIVNDHSRIAIFTGPEVNSSWVVGEGERVGSYTVTAIRPNEAQLAGPAGSVTVQPSSRQDARAFWLARTPATPLIDPAYREAITETDQ